RLGVASDIAFTLASSNGVPQARATGEQWHAEIDRRFVSIDGVGGSLRLSTSFARGDVPVTPIAGEPTLEEGAAIRRSGTVVERARARTKELEAGWVLGAAPEGGGDLVVALDPQGSAARTADESGVHVTAPDGSARFVVGHGTWIDARRIRTPIRAEVRGD